MAALPRPCGAPGLGAHPGLNGAEDGTVSIFRKPRHRLLLRLRDLGASGARGSERGTCGAVVSAGNREIVASLTCSTRAAPRLFRRRADRQQRRALLRRCCWAGVSIVLQRAALGGPAERAAEITGFSRRLPLVTQPAIPASNTFFPESRSPPLSKTPKPSRNVTFHCPCTRRAASMPCACCPASELEAILDEEPELN